jgi:hypothetical protein
VAVGFSGDVLQAENRAKEAKNGVKIGYRFPRKARRSGSTWWPCPPMRRTRRPVTPS